MLLAPVYAVVCWLSELLLPRAAADRAAAIERLALRHEVRVLRRLVKRTRWRPANRLRLAALSRCVPRGGWWRFPVRPETLVRWHRALARRRWAAFGRCRGTLAPGGAQVAAAPRLLPAVLPLPRPRSPRKVAYRRRHPDAADQ